jgi:TolB-like protein/AraC-like DNA-binding protein
MPGTTPSENEFLEQLNGAIEKNLANNRFGVEELADVMNMSRSNLLRKVKKLTGLSATQLISKIRLEKAKELLKNSSKNISEIADEVGFGSSSYFIKVFREKYGYSPGKTAEQQSVEQQGIEVKPKKFKLVLIGIAATVLCIAVVFFWPSPKAEKEALSIAVLPFKNESADSSNVYLINGLMESTLNNLQQIPSLKVISRTTSEKYRDTKKSIPEMAKELNVNYFVEGSGQKMGDNILLNIQLIEAATDRHVWAKQYRRETGDIFELQHEIAKNIADEIEVVITPEADRRIRQRPTNNLVAYDYFLKGRELFYRSGRGDLDSSLHYFAKAIEYDSTFALAYATAATVHYYLDIFMLKKTHEKALDSCADRALKYGPGLAESNIAKGVSYAAKKKYSEAVVYLEKAHELDPHSGLPIHFITEFYSIHVFNTAKYLEYALIGVKIDQESPVDSATTSFKYFHLANAFAGAGFIDEAMMYVNKSLDFNANSPFAKYFRVYIQFAKDKNVKRAREEMVSILRQDTMRVDIVQEVGKLYVMERDYANAYKTYLSFIDLRKLYDINVYQGEALRMAPVWDELGHEKEGAKYLDDFLKYSEKDESIYRHLNLCTYHAYKGNKEKAIQEFRTFLDEDNNFHYWAMLLDNEPYMDKIKDMPEYKALFKEMQEDFWENNRAIRKSMEGKGLL